MNTCQASHFQMSTKCFTTATTALFHCFWADPLHSSRGRDGSVVTAPDSWLKGCGFESLLEQQENFLFQGWLSVLTLISVSIPPHVTAVARERSRSFCQKRRWQVTTKHTYTLHICGFAWSDIVHGCMVYTGLALRRLQFHVAPAMPAL